jgi:hypothetical protein
VAGVELMVIAGAAMAFLAFVSFLAFCAFVVVRTGGTAGLRDVAVAVRAYASVASSLRLWKKS